ncbi:cyclin-dependent kinase 9 isoform X1 [Hemicordylus capensis]|uniref:cyclin-dependent kinase 9 isoform X1 n=1 Tax=Hemicordylus capensis TaxID=884348 RepID=UPI002304A4FE|nr:cyclin-dependent kinase 9 isoform X1 [Hemicordylus capensis]
MRTARHAGGKAGHCISQAAPRRRCRKRFSGNGAEGRKRVRRRAPAGRRAPPAAAARGERRGRQRRRVRHGQAVRDGGVPLLRRGLQVREAGQDRAGHLRFPITALREIKILQLLKHENVVNLIEICRTKASPYNRCKGSIYLVFDFCEHDLAGLLSNAHVKFTLSEIKKVMQMLLNGLYYIHRNKILHRDMKAANVLITRDGVLKLADFGLARAFSLAKNSQPNRYTNRVVTLWYRPPELLLGERDYGPPIDLWGAGCIMAEMWTRSPIMQGNTEQHQLTLISQLCGSITPEVWPNVDKYELYQKLDLPKGQKRKVKDRLKAYVKDQYALDLIDKLLVLDPAQRIDSDDALNHDFFWSDPMPSDLKNMLSTHNQSMFEYLAPPRRRGGHVPQAPNMQGRNPAATNQTEFDRVF